MIKEYICKETFVVSNNENKGGSPEKSILIVKGSRWVADTQDFFTHISDIRKVRLKRLVPKREQFIEIGENKLKTNFVQVT